MQTLCPIHFQEASQRMPAPRYHHPSKPRRALLENIEELFGMFAVLEALQALCLG